jgi:hypothetical protein
MVYEGATPDGLCHTLCRDDGSKVVTPPSHVHFLEQPDFSNILSTPLDYRNEVGIGITKEEAQELAYPCILSPSQQELLSWHHCLYQLPSQQELLSWHHCLYHLPFAPLSRWKRCSGLQSKDSASLPPVPRCF